MAKVRPKRRVTYSVEQKLTALSEEDRVDEEFMFVWKYSIEVLLGCSETTDVALGGTNALTSLCADVIFRESQSNSYVCEEAQYSMAQAQESQHTGLEEYPERLKTRCYAGPHYRDFKHPAPFSW